MQSLDNFYKMLESIQWFSQCGFPLPEELPFECSPVKDWGEAAFLCGGEYWDWVTMEARNMTTMFLSRFHHDEYQKWNHIVFDSNEVLERGIWAKIEAYAEKHNINGHVVSRVRWDTGNAVSEAAYQEFNPPIFFLKLLKVYESGHFPCGWEGEFPKGKLLVW